MSYSATSRFVRVFDRNASPVYMEWIAGRYGIVGNASWYSDENIIYLDLGCAEGDNILKLAPLYPHIRFIGVDLNPLHVEAALQNVQDLGLDNVNFQCADFTTCDALPKAAYINIHGTYSWLADNVKNSLESRLEEASRPGTLLKLHYNVKPGSQLRENLGHLFSTLDRDATPANAKRLLQLFDKEAKGLKLLYSTEFFDILLKQMMQNSEEMWLHDYLNPDFQAEYSDVVMGRLQKKGFDFIASAVMEQNIFSITAGQAAIDFSVGIQSVSRHSFMDHVTGRGTRDDLFAMQPARQQDFSFHEQIRLGCLWPRERMLAPYMTSQGQVNFRQADCELIVDALQEKPLRLSELQQLLPMHSQSTLLFWVDLLMAAIRISPFLPDSSVDLIDREKVREINRWRLTESMTSFSLDSSTFLLAVELGNCIEVGFFETLVLHHFDQRHEAATQQLMLERLASAGISIRNPDGQISRDQAAALKMEISKLEQGYLNQLNYWGLEI
jgi:trans-aconitate methyltransferase